MNAGHRWIAIVVALLVSSLLAQVILLVVASSDPAFAIEPDYEQRARNWDAEQRQQSVNRALGWTVDLRTRPTTGDDGFEVALVAADRAGAAITGADVTIEALANARARQVHRPVLAEPEAGRYTGRVRARRSGLWEFRVVVERGDERYTQRIRKEVLTGFTAARSAGR